ncbi:HD domain-containing protein [uncultured Ilyobacter sp.]|uniref:HD domain-containing protein n=1 Tax=uncultured Ilyobacter sp. TaxID=544433 RepID=UPI0029BFAE39|nr:HD domain-containing protein [uncultured Ilyobacter sp.]
MEVNEIQKLMISYFGKDVRRINHALKVYCFAKSIGESENLDSEKQKILEISAILHDIGIKISEEKYNSSAGKYQELEGPDVARKLIKDIDLSEKIKERICYLIGNHHSYDKIDGLDFQILVEADFLVNIYEDNMSSETAATVKKKYFETKTGIEYISSLYGV